MSGFIHFAEKVWSRCTCKGFSARLETMAVLKDKQTDLFIADTDIIPFSGTRPEWKDVQEALKPMILSASGWRKVFAPSGDEESAEESLTPADSVLAGAMAYVFAPFFKGKERQGETGRNHSPGQPPDRTGYGRCDDTGFPLPGS